jgi:hypothetical protein
MTSLKKNRKSYRIFQELYSTLSQNIKFIMKIIYINIMAFARGRITILEYFLYRKHTYMLVTWQTEPFSNVQLHVTMLSVLLSMVWFHCALPQEVRLMVAQLLMFNLLDMFWRVCTVTYNSGTSIIHKSNNNINIIYP